jgi:hypothetical protein
MVGVLICTHTLPVGRVDVWIWTKIRRISCVINVINTGNTAIVNKLCMLFTHLQVNFVQIVKNLPILLASCHHSNEERELTNTVLFKEPISLPSPLFNSCFWRNLQNGSISLNLADGSKIGSEGNELTGDKTHTMSTSATCPSKLEPGTSLQVRFYYNLISVVLLDIFCDRLNRAMLQNVFILSYTPCIFSTTKSNPYNVEEPKTQYVSFPKPDPHHNDVALQPVN